MVPVTGVCVSTSSVQSVVGRATAVGKPEAADTCTRAIAIVGNISYEGVESNGVSEVGCSRDALVTLKDTDVVSHAYICSLVHSLKCAFVNCAPSLTQYHIYNPTTTEHKPNRKNRISIAWQPSASATASPTGHAHTHAANALTYSPPHTDTTERR